MPARAQVDGEVEIEHPARAPEDRRPIGREPRPVRADEQVGRQHLLLLSAELGQAR
jgi:hypothetical protein